MTKIFSEGETVYFYDIYYRSVSYGECHSIVYGDGDSLLGYILTKLRIERLDSSSARPSDVRYVNASKAFSTSDEVKRHRMIVTLRGEWY